MSVDRTISRALARGLPGAIGPAPLPKWTNDVLLSFTDANGNPIGPPPKNLLGAEGPAGDSTNFLTRTRARASVIPIILMVIRVLAFADGFPIEPAFYKPGTSAGPSAFQDNNGTGNWWELDLTGSLHYASWYGVNGDAGEYSAPLQTAVTFAKGIEVRLPVGIVGLASQVHYITTLNFAAGMRLSGAANGLTVIDNRCTTGNGCIYSAGTAFGFQQGGFIKGIWFKTTTASSIPAIDMLAVYRFTVEDVFIDGMTANGCTITGTLGDPDASNIVRFKSCYFMNNGGAGLLHNFATTVIQTSFVKCEDCFFLNNGLAGWYWIGLTGSMENCAFTENGWAAGGQGGLWIPNNAASNAQFAAYGCSWENNYKSAIRIDTLQGGEFIGCEIAGGVISATLGFGLTSVVAVRIEGTRVRIGSALNPYTAFQLGTGCVGNVISDTYWRTFDTTGQRRYDLDNAGLGNRVSDSFDSIQVGSVDGTTTIACATGANHNVALPNDGAAFGIGGPGGAFSIGGLTNAYDGRGACLFNNSGQTLTIIHDDGLSTAGQRIYCSGGTNLVIPNFGTVTLRKMAFVNHWVVTGHS